MFGKEAHLSGFFHLRRPTAKTWVFAGSQPAFLPAATAEAGMQSSRHNADQTGMIFLARMARSLRHRARIPTQGYHGRASRSARDEWVASRARGKRHHCVALLRIALIAQRHSSLARRANGLRLCPTRSLLLRPN